jgi:lysophospholipase L1-like esterase
MAIPDEKQKLRPDEGLDIIEQFVALVPEMYYGANRLLEESTGAHFSKKDGVALWALAGANQRDEVGPYMTISELVATFTDWFVVSDERASSVFSKVKKDLMDVNYVKIEGGTDHVHLTPKGEQTVREMIARATDLVKSTISVLSLEEQRSLLRFAQLMIGNSHKKRPDSDFLR